MIRPNSNIQTGCEISLRNSKTAKSNYQNCQSTFEKESQENLEGEGNVF